MSPFWQNKELLPSSIREKAREKPKRSAKEYAKSREKVREGVREAGEMREKNKKVAEIRLYVELNEDKLKEKMMDEKLCDMVGDEFSSYDKKRLANLQRIIGEGRFNLEVEKSDNGQAQISMVIDLPEGNVSEKLPLNRGLQEAIAARATGNM